MVKNAFSSLWLVLVLSSSALAAPKHEAPEIPKDFEAMKSLVGTWEGTSKMGDKDEKVAIVYELTSGGTALTAKLGPGSPYEMVTVYHKQGKSVGMTHFCASGNQPQMVLKKTDGKFFAFEMNKNLGISSPKENHMHAVTLTLKDPDSLTEEWVNYENGKQSGTMVFNFKRVNKPVAAP